MKPYFQIISGAMLLLSSHAVFADWQELYRWQDAIAYIDLKQVSRNGDVVQLPQLVDYQLPKFAEGQPNNAASSKTSAKASSKPPSKPSAPYKSLISVMEFNCKTRQSREIVYYFAQNMAMGEGEHRLPIEAGASRRYDPTTPVNFDEVLKLSLVKAEPKKEEKPQESGIKTWFLNIFKSDPPKTTPTPAAEAPKLVGGWTDEQPWQKTIREMACSEDAGAAKNQ